MSRLVKCTVDDGSSTQIASFWLLSIGGPAYGQVRAMYKLTQVSV